MQRNRWVLWSGATLALVVAALAVWKAKDGGTPETLVSSGEPTSTPADAEHRPPAEIQLAPSPGQRPTDDAPTREAAPIPAGAAPRVTITERVLAADGTPLAGANVDVRIDDEAVWHATSDETGRVSVDVETPERADAMAVVVTRATGGLVAIRPAFWWSGGPGVRRQRLSKVDLGDVRLAVGASVAFQVKVASGAGVVADVVVTQRWSPTQPVASVKSSVDGRAKIEALAPGPYYAYAQGTSGRGTVWFAMPRKSTDPIEIVLSELRDVDVTVVAKDTRAPVADARIELLESTMTPENAHTMLAYVPRVEVAPTDAKGRTRLVGLSKGASIGVVVTATGFPPPPAGIFGRGAAPLVPIDSSSMEIELDRGRTVSWEVTSGEVAPPPEGTVLALEQQAGSGTSPPSGTGRMSGGKIVIDGVPAEPTHWTAVAPDGSQASLFSLPDALEGRATSFVAARKVDVTLKWSDGTPAAGLFVSLRNQGNNPMGTPVPTDERGAATLDHLESQMADVYVGMTSTPYGGRRIATADLRKGSAHVDSVIPTRREGTIMVFLDGAAGLPPSIEPMASFFGGVEVDITSRDAGSGTLHVLVWPLVADAKTEFGLDASGWLSDAAIPVPTGSGPFQGRLELHAAGSVDVEVVKPKSGRVSLRLDRVDEPKSGSVLRYFGSDSYGPGQARLDAEGHWRLPTIPPGRYRVRDSLSSSTSEEFTVLAGAETTVRFDCSSVGTIEGTVIVPEGESAAGLTVHLVPAPSTGPFDSHRDTKTGALGEFKITVPGDRDVVLTADAPLLVPAVDGGMAHTRAGVKDATIRLVRGAVCHVQFDRIVSARPGWDGAKVYFWKGIVPVAPLSEATAVIEGDEARFSHFESGTYSLFLDLGTDAPVEFQNVRLDEGETHIGPVKASTGTSIVFAISAPAGQSVPRLNASAVRVDGKPAYQRSADVVDKGRITGLGKGRFRVRAYPQMGGAILLDQEVETDGTTDVNLRIELK